MQSHEVKLSIKETFLVLYRTAGDVIKLYWPPALVAGVLLLLVAGNYYALTVLELTKDLGGIILSWFASILILIPEVLLLMYIEAVAKYLYDEIRPHYYAQKLKAQQEALKKIDEKILIK